jgi:S1-C subfamily serine protease
MCLPFMKSVNIIFILSLLFPAAWPVSSGYGQTSIIDQMQKTQASIVTIRSDLSSFYKTPGNRAAIDPRTGRMVVLNTLTKASYRRGGAGVIVHSSGIIVTNAHVVDKANEIKVVLHDQTEVPAQVLTVVGNLDMALLKINSPYSLTAVTIANSDEIRLGDEIMTVGNSEFLNQTLSGGKVIGLGVNRTEQKEGHTRNDLIQTTVNLYEGDSGGPLFDRNGFLIGLMTAKETAADHSSFAIPSNKIKQYLVEYLRTHS